MIRSFARISSSLALVLVSGTAIAQQRKPLPPEPAPQAHQLSSERLANMNEFLDAYRRAGSPRLLFSTDVIPMGHSTGTLELGESLGARLEDLFRDPEVIIVNHQATGLRNAQQRDALRGNDEVAAARILARDVGADMVINLRLTEKPRCGQYAASYVITDLRQGTTLGRFAFDMLPDPQSGSFDNSRVSEYARAIAGRMSRQFIEAFPASVGGGAYRRYTLRIVGDYSPDDLEFLRDALNLAPGVRTGSVNLRGEERSSGALVTTLDLLSSQDLLAMRQTLRRSVNEQLVMGTEVLDATGQAINVRLTPLDLSDTQRALAGGPRTARNSAERDRLAQAYARANNPSIAVIINRATASTPPLPAPVESASASAEGPQTSIIIGNRVDLSGTGSIDSLYAGAIADELTDRRREQGAQREFDVRALEARVIQRLSSLALNLVDTASAQAELTRSGGLEGKDWTDREFASVLGAKANADIVLSGVAKVTRTRATEYPLRVELTMQAVRRSDSRVLGASTSSREVASAGVTLDQAMDALTAEAVGRLVSQLAESWSR